MNQEKLVYVIKTMIENNDFKLNSIPFYANTHALYAGRLDALDWVYKLITDEEYLEHCYKANKLADRIKSENK